MKYVYLVGLREVHVNTVRVESDKPLSLSEAVAEAKQNAVDGSVMVEYSHVIDDPGAHTIESVNEAKD